MERLTQGDFQALLQCLRELYAPLDLEAFTKQILSVLSQVVPAERMAYGEINRPKRRLATVSEPVDEAATLENAQILVRHMGEHPVISHYLQTGDGRAYRRSDFLTRRQVHRLALYNELLRKIGSEYDMSVHLPSPPSLVIGIGLSRSRPDFSERDRLVLNLLRPHLIQAYHNAEAVTQMQQEMAGLRQAAEESEHGVILLSIEGRVRWMTGQARRWVVDYFGKLPRAGRLPEELGRWVQGQRVLLAQEGQVPPPRAPLSVEREGRRLVVRLIAGQPADPPLLLLEEERTVLSAAALASLGLGQREAEVFFWIAQGKTNDTVGEILGLSPRTVQKHLERIYQKLGVETRVAAIMRALKDLGLLRR